MSSLVMIALALDAASAVLDKRFALMFAVAGIPLYIVRLYPMGIPTNLWELMVVIVAIAFFHDSSFWQRIRQIRPSRFTQVALALIVLGLVFGVVVAPDKLIALGIIKGWIIVPTLLALLVYGVRVQNTATFIASAAMLGAVPLIADSIFQILAGTQTTLDGRASAWFSSPNYLALFIVPVGLLAMFLAGQKILDKKTTVVASGLLILAGLLAAGSIGGLFALGAGLVAGLAWMYRRHTAKIVGAAVVAAAATGAALYMYYPRFSELFNLSSQTSASVRLQVWGTGLQMIREHWITGVGLGSYEPLYLSYATKLYGVPLESNILHPHNLLLQLWISLGVLGVIGFSLIVIQWFRTAWQSKQTPYTAGLVAAMVAILAHGIIDTPVFKNDLAAIFALVITLLYVRKENNKKV